MITAEVVVVAVVVVAFSSRPQRPPRPPLPYLAFPAFLARPDTRWPLLRCFAWSAVAELTVLLIVRSSASYGHFVD